MYNATMGEWTIYGLVLLDNLNEGVYIRVQAASPQIDGHGLPLQGTTVQAFVDVPPIGVATAPEAVLAYNSLSQMGGTFIRVIGTAPGGGIFLLPAAEVEA